MFLDIRNHVDMIHGDYVLVLSDDNVLIDPDVFGDLKTFVEENDRPDVVIWCGVLPGQYVPTQSTWKRRPELNHIDLSCYVVARNIWINHAQDWLGEYAADYYFIAMLWDLGYRFTWFDRLAYRAIVVSRGVPE